MQYNKTLIRGRGIQCLCRECAGNGGGGGDEAFIDISSCSSSSSAALAAAAAPDRRTSPLPLPAPPRCWCQVTPGYLPPLPARHRLHFHLPISSYSYTPGCRMFYQLASQLQLCARKIQLITTHPLKFKDIITAYVM